MPSTFEGSDCTLTVLGRWGLRYAERGDSILIDGEMVVGEHQLAIRLRSIATWEKSGEEVSQEDRARIIANIKALLLANRVPTLFD